MNAGGVKRAIRSVANASRVTSAGPAMAHNAASPTISAPIRSPSCPSQPNSNTRGSEISARGRVPFAIESGGPQPRVEEGVRQIGDEGEQDVNAREHQHYRLYHWEIVLADRLPGEIADTMEREHLLD